MKGKMAKDMPKGMHRMGDGKMMSDKDMPMMKGKMPPKEMPKLSRLHKGK